MIDVKTFHNKFVHTAYRDEAIDSYYVQRATEQDYDCVAEIKQALNWADTPGCYLFSGHRGAGKTTELKRLMQELEDSAIAAFYCDVEDYLDLNDPQKAQTELVFTALAGLSDEVRKKYCADVLKESIWERINNKLQAKVELRPKLNIPGVSGAGIEFSLQENVRFKQELIRFAEQSSQFDQEAKEFAAELRQIIQEQSGRQKIALIVDSLERLSAPRGEEQTLFNSLKSLFFNHPARLALDDINLIYTVPPYINAVLPNVSAYYADTFYLPNFKVIDKPEAGQQATKNAAGIAKMLAIVERRDANWRDYVSQPVLEHLAWLSGGNVIRYFSLIRQLLKKAALTNTDFPVSDPASDVVRRAISEEARPLQWLTAEDRRWLNLIRQDSGEFAKAIENLEADFSPIIRLFDHSLVLNYQNGESWHQAPPIVYEHL